MTALEAEHVVWDLSDLLHGRDDEGAVCELLARADVLADDLASHRGEVASWDAAALAGFMQKQADLSDVIGRAGSWASLRFAVDVNDPTRGALVQKVSERGTAIQTKLLWFELEWAALDDARVDELLAHDQLTFCAHHLRSARRYREHLLTEPEETILTEKSVTGRGAWSRLFNELTSTIEVELDGRTTTLEEGLSRLGSPDPEVRRVSAQAVTDALRPGLRTRAYIFNTLLH